MYVIIDISIHTQHFQQTQFAKIGVGWVGEGFFSVCASHLLAIYKVSHNKQYWI